MRFLLAGTLATLTAAGLASIRPALLSDEERAAATAIRENRLRADSRFLANDALEGRAAGARGDLLARAYLASRLEAIGLEPGVPGGSWAQPFDPVGLLRGGDAELAREAVVYTARLGDASGVAALLAIAEAFAALPERPRRSILFAAVGAEGHGPLGPSPLARHLPVPVGRLAAHLDIDGVSGRGRTRDVRVAGLGQSSLDDWVRALAEAQGRVVLPEARADGGGSVSPHAVFAAAGVPSLCLDAGAVEDARLLFHLGAKVANAGLGR